MDGETSASKKEDTNEDEHQYSLKCLCNTCTSQTAQEAGYHRLDIVRPSEFFNDIVTAATFLPAILYADKCAKRVEDIGDEVLIKWKAKKYRLEKQRQELARHEEYAARQRERGQPSSRVGLFEDPKGRNRELPEEPRKVSSLSRCFRG